METDSQKKYQIVVLEEAVPCFFRVHYRSVANSAKSAMVLEHWHKDLEVNYVLQGPTDYIVDGKSRLCAAGDVCIINSGCIHSINKRFTCLDNKIDAFTVIIDYDFLRSLVPDLDNSHFEVDQDSLPLIRECLGKLLKGYLEWTGPYRDIALTGLVYELVYILCEHCKKDKSPVELRSQRHIQQIYRIMEDVRDHYQETVSQSDAAGRLGFSREHLSRFFKQYTGLTYLEYLTRYRIDKAKQRLETTDQTEIEIALDTGFSGVKQMSGSFKKYLGMTPSQFRKSINLR